MNKPLMCKIAYRMHQGNREDQQDFVGISEKNGLILGVVCDGMGGLENGALASRTAVKTLSDMFEKTDVIEDIPDFFLECIDIMDESVYNISNKERNEKMTGTTVVSVCVKDNNLYWMSVGDSRLYIIRENEIVSATRDHNYFLLLDEMKRNNAADHLCMEEEIKKATHL